MILLRRPFFWIVAAIIAMFVVAPSIGNNVQMREDLLLAAVYIVLASNLAHFTKKIADNLVADRGDTDPTTLADQFDDHPRTGKCLTGARRPLDRQHRRFTR